MILIFDLDGTLVDTSERTHRVYAEVIESMSGSPLPKDAFWRLKRQRATHEQILERSGLNAAMKPIFLERFVALVETPENLKLDKRLTRALETVDFLAAQGDERFLLTLRRNEATLKQELAELSLDRHFDRVLTGHTEGEGFTKKVELIRDEILRGRKERAVVTGDTEADIRAAKALAEDGHDVVSVAVCSGIRDEKFLRNLDPDYVLKSLSGLPEVITGMGLAAPASRTPGP